MVHLGVKKSSSTEVNHGPPRNFRLKLRWTRDPTSEVLRYNMRKLTFSKILIPFHLRMIQTKLNFDFSINFTIICPNSEKKIQIIELCNILKFFSNKSFFGKSRVKICTKK
jgi:hypothetical protein